MMTWVSISGTALAIFLVMSFYMTDQLGTVEAAPESQRSLMLYGGGFHYKSPQIEYNSTMNLNMVERMYGNLDGIAQIALSSSWDQTLNASVNGKIATALENKSTDGNFWKIYDFTFISGHPYDDADMEGGLKKVVITQSVARNFFDKDDAAGEILYLNTIPYTVAGVVRDVNASFNATFSNIYTPLDADELHNPEDEYMGGLMVHLLREPGVSEQSIKDQLQQRYDRLNQELKKDSTTAIYHGAPHNAEYLAKSSIFSNITPDLSKQKRSDYIIYFVLMLIPAINLSAMMRGRLRHRVSEIGVRRAFGAKRRNIVGQLLGENFIITLIGGAIGLALSLIFMLFLSSYFIEIGDVEDAALKFASDMPTVAMLFTWRSFAIALGVCFILNLLSAFVPSWKASRVQPAEAISKSKI